MDFSEHPGALEQHQDQSLRRVKPEGHMTADEYWKFTNKKTLSNCQWITEQYSNSYFTYSLTYSMEHSPTWEDKHQEIPREFIEPEGSLPHTQLPAPCPNPEPARSCPYPPIPLPEDPS